MTVQDSIAKVTSLTYELTRPRQICEIQKERLVHPGDIVVEPTLASICHADLRYYTGQRRPEALARKLPMALIHEGIGRVIQSASPKLDVGQRVAIVPNMPGYLLHRISPHECCDACRRGIGDNYCLRGQFLGSGTDGIAQSRLVLPAECTVPLPSTVPDEIAVLAELSSVAYHAIRHVRDKLSNYTVAVFGDGPVGYITAALLHHMFHVSRPALRVYGAIPERLAHFEFTEQALIHQCDFDREEKVDVVIECTGGQYSSSAINQGIQVLQRGGCLILMGVSEELVPVNTRDVLEKGLTLIGSSRSSTADFQAVVSAMTCSSYQETLRRLLPQQSRVIGSASDLAAALDEAVTHR
ncbi:MAG: alcohol dehydrogenase catalytic domain-containing protein, partial [Alicyclobacillus sp.]|nr:alcohol dehydrogenase catalytic domain-containing protein [Alicyclobacillus sp.]